MKNLLGIASVLCFVAATVLLFLASRPVPWDRQSIGGKTLPEESFRLRRRLERNWGLGLTFVALALQLAAIFTVD